MTDTSPIPLGHDAATVSVPERVTSALLALHFPLGVEGRDPDMDQAIEICDGLARALVRDGVEFDRVPVELGLPKWLRILCLEAETGYFARLIDALDARESPRRLVEDLVLGLEDVLRDARPCQDITAERPTDVSALAAYSAEAEKNVPVGPASARQNLLTDARISSATQARLARRRHSRWS